MKRLFLIVSLCLAATVLQAQNKKITIRPPRPKVGVVLGGGGAKGAAHIGVLKYMEEMGIPVDYVAGTSMGSIIGGLYAMGYTPEELTQLIASMDWSQYIGNKIDRPMMSEEARRRSSTSILNIPFGRDSQLPKDPNGGLMSQLPSAYVNNSSLVNLFNDLCVGYQEDMDFNDMPIPFACVATDLITGQEVVLRSGNVPTAMRASMAIPGVFAPVEMGDYVLVDGGLVNNFPADVLRDMGADIIIGVEITKERQFTAADFKSLPQVMSRLLTNTTSAKREENRDLCNLYIVPDVNGYGMLSFNAEAIDTLVERGYKKAHEYHDQLLTIKEAIERSAGHTVGKELHAPRAKNLDNDSVMIRYIEIKGANQRQTQWLIRKGGLKVGQDYSKSGIEHAINIFRGTSCFDDITYTIKESDSIHQQGDDQLSDAYDLTINMQPAQPHVVGLGVRYDTEEGAALLFNIGLNAKKFNGSKLDFSAKLSYNPRIGLTYTYSRSSLANFNIFYNLRNEHNKNRYLYNDFINFHHYQQRIGASISQFHLLNLKISGGAYLLSTTFDKLGIAEEEAMEAFIARNKEFVPFLEFQYDNLDDAYFAKHGIYGKVRGELSFDIDSSQYNSQNVNLAFQGYITPMNGRVTFIPQAYGRVLFGNDKYYNRKNFYGGEVAGRHYDQQLPFIGINYAQDGAPIMGILRFDVRYNFFGKHYLTAMYNVLYEHYGYFNAINYGVGMKYSYNSPLGPISLTGQWDGLTNKFSGYFSFGYTF